MKRATRFIFLVSALFALLAGGALFYSAPPAFWGLWLGHAAGGRFVHLACSDLGDRAAWCEACYCPQGEFVAGSGTWFCDTGHEDDFAPGAARVRPVCEALKN
jgi:hypothetical protein